VIHGDVTEDTTMAMVDEDGGEESGGVKDIFKDVDVMKYLKEVELEASWSTKEKD
jgi:hypothetical protein